MYLFATDSFFGNTGQRQRAKARAEAEAKAKTEAKANAEAQAKAEAKTEAKTIAEAKAEAKAEASSIRDLGPKAGQLLRGLGRRLHGPRPNDLGPGTVPSQPLPCRVF